MKTGFYARSTLALRLEVASIRGERAGTSLPGSLTEALARLGEANARIADLESENAQL